MAKNKQTNKLVIQPLHLVVTLIIGVAIGVIVKPQTKQLTLATAAQKQEAESAIRNLIAGGDKLMCASEDNPKNLVDTTQVFNAYLKINGFANRAVARGCGGMDALLAKNKKGEWVLTPVNMALDARVNPKWQKACMIQDITTEDTEVRPENSSIDSNNYRECLKLDNL